MTRRTMLAACALPALVGASPSRPGSLGLVIHSFAVRGALDRSKPKAERFDEPGRFLDHGRSIGAGCVQVGLGIHDDAWADALRARAEAAEIVLEGIAALPLDEADVARFEAEIRTAKRAGATVVRTVMLSGRRYETFKSIDEFRKFADRARASLRLAAPVVERLGIGLAVENHKDWRAEELIEMIKGAGSDRLGVCLDTGNSMALLEDPIEVVKALAPLALTTHFKDMGVEESQDGFLLAEVPLGTGVVDLPRVVEILRGARPGIRINLEMITRDPLKIPCLADSYWATFPTLPAPNLARALSFVRAHRPASPLPRVSRLDPEAQVGAEDDNIRRCFAHARDRLGL